MCILSVWDSSPFVSDTPCWVTAIPAHLQPGFDLAVGWHPCQTGSAELLLEQCKQIKAFTQHGVSLYSAVISLDRKCRIEGCVDSCHVVGFRAAFGFLWHAVLSAFQTQAPVWQRFRTIRILAALLQAASPCHSLYSSWTILLVKTFLCLLWRGSLHLSKENTNRHKRKKLNNEKK